MTAAPEAAGSGAAGRGEAAGPDAPVPPVVTGYLALGLRLGRLVDGFVDCWFGGAGDAVLDERLGDEVGPAK
ncbi:hypothetical protein AB0J52_33700, partial [Spirillospora sp. NPDC049652]